ncbi:MAG: DEAD/DEAH box helicase, partial [Nevskiaceae bacterium]
MTPERLVAVAVPAPLYTAFDYRAGEEMTIRAGMRVRVPFGARQVVGVALEAPRIAQPGPRPGPGKYKTVAAVLDAEPLLPDELLELCRFAAGYYQHPLGEVLATALPSRLRQGGDGALEAVRWLRMTPAGRSALESLAARARAQRRLLEQLGSGPASRKDLPGHSPTVLRKLLQNQWIEWFEPPVEVAAREAAPPLTDEQTAALRTLRQVTGFGVTLLEGITGSGKTELYLRRAADVLEAGRQVLVLVPEIGLTPQLAGRFLRRFGAGVASYHSGMPDGERAQAWL